MFRAVALTLRARLRSASNGSHSKTVWKRLSSKQTDAKNVSATLHLTNCSNGREPSGRRLETAGEGFAQKVDFNRVCERPFAASRPSPFARGTKNCSKSTNLSPP